MFPPFDNMLHFQFFIFSEQADQQRYDAAEMIQEALKDSSSIFKFQKIAWEKY